MDDYGYLNARVRFMKGRLLENEVYDTLLNLEEAGPIVDMLLNTDYASEVSEALSRHSVAEAINVGLGNSLYVTFRKLLRMASGEPRKLIWILLGRWDVRNVKSILRGLHNHVDPSVVAESFVPAGELDRLALEELARQTDVQSVASLLGTWNVELVEPLRKSLKGYLQTRDLAALEREFDQRHFDDCFGKLDGNDRNEEIVREILQMETDLCNIGMGLRLLGHAEALGEAQQYFIRGGALKPRFLATMLAAGGADGAMTTLEGTKYHTAIEKGLLHYSSSGRVSVLERFLQDVLIRRAASFAFREPLSIGVIVAYLWLKCNEVMNLRLITRCRPLGMPAAMVREELIFI